MAWSRMGFRCNVVSSTRAGQSSGEGYILPLVASWNAQPVTWNIVALAAYLGSTVLVEATSELQEALANIFHQKSHSLYLCWVPSSHRRTRSCGRDMTKAFTHATWFLIYLYVTTASCENTAPTYVQTCLFFSAATKIATFPTQRPNTDRKFETNQQQHVVPEEEHTGAQQRPLNQTTTSRVRHESYLRGSLAYTWHHTNIIG